MNSADTSHLVALRTRLANEKERFSQDKSEIRKVWIAQISKEIDREMRFLGMPTDDQLPEMTTDELLQELLG